MKTRLSIITVVLALVFCCASSQAQNKQHPITSPPSIAGDTVFVEEYDSNLSLELLVPDGKGDKYTAIPIYNSDSDSGDCTYSNSNNIGLLITTNHLKGKWEDITLTFTNADGGTFTYTLPVHGDSGWGSFKIALGTAPASCAGETFCCTTGKGNFNIYLSGSGALYCTLGTNGANNGSGSCSITNLNRSTLCAQLTDSSSGSSCDAYFCFADTNSGFFCFAETNGSYEVGDFTLTNSLPPFFCQSVDLGDDWHFLSPGTKHLFGYFSTYSLPYIYHDDMGWEYYIDAGNANSGAYFYDFNDGAWFYSEPGLFPYLYDFKLNHWLWYEPQPGTTDHCSSNPRWFYDITAGEWINQL